MNQNTPGEPSREDIARLEALRGKLMSLTWMLEQTKKELLANQTAPPDWPTISHKISTASSSVKSIHDFINQDPETTAALGALHSYPIPPFPLGNPEVGALADTIFRKIPDVKENDWILAKLTKAAEFAHVPGDWGIEAKKPAENDVQEQVEDGRLRRRRGNLDEDQLADLWGDATGIVQEASEIAITQHEEGGESDEEGDESDEEMEDVVGMDTPSQAAASAPAPAKVIAQPMMSLDTIHKFMSTGAVV